MNLLRRLRSLGPAGIFRRLGPRRIDQLIFVMDNLPHVALPDGPERIERYSASSRSGVPSIDSRLAGSRDCYAALIEGQVAHQSWVIRDAILPSQFGFERQSPVVGDCVTPEPFRGRGLYARTLIRIARDHFARPGAVPIYILVAPDNLPSIRGIERAGFRLAGRLRGLRILGVVLRARARVSPRLDE